MIVGAGTGGTLTANRLRREHGEDVSITVIDEPGDHVYQPGLLFLPFGLTEPADIVRPRSRQLHDGIEFRPGAVDRVEVSTGMVHLEDGSEVGYDVLVIASGSRLLPEETEGLEDAFANGRAFSFYDLEGAVALRDALDGFTGGRIVINPVDMPIKCPVAPLEFCFLADWFFHREGLRDQVEITYVTPLDGAFTKPVASRELGGLLESKAVAMEAEFATGEVDGDGGRIVSWDQREVGFDILVSIPVHGGAEFVNRSPGLGDELGFVKTDAHSLQSTAAPNVFAIGDATNLPTSKAGSVTHFEGETLTANIDRYLKGRGARGKFRRARQLLHRDRLPQGAADRLQLRRRAVAGPLPGEPRRTATAERIKVEPHGETRFPALLLARPSAGPRRSRCRGADVNGRQAAGPQRTRSCRMSTVTYAGTPVEVDAEGFLEDPAQWNEQVAGQIAAENGIPELNERHWMVVNYMRDTYLEEGSAPSIRSLGKASGVPIKELYELFPKGPAKLAAKIGGIPKPRGCI